MNMKRIITTLLLGSLLGLNANADRGGSSERGERRGPPPEAFEACADLAEAAVCEVQTRRGDLLPGQCRVPRRQFESADGDSLVQLLCVPDRHKRRRDRSEEVT